MLNTRFYLFFAFFSIFFFWVLDLIRGCHHINEAKDDAHRNKIKLHARIDS
jgi:hypothetical protein